MSVEPVGGNNGPQCGPAGVVDRVISAMVEIVAPWKSGFEILFC